MSGQRRKCSQRTFWTVGRHSKPRCVHQSQLLSRPTPLSKLAHTIICLHLRQVKDYESVISTGVAFSIRGMIATSGSATSLVASTEDTSFHHSLSCQLECRLTNRLLRQPRALRLFILPTKQETWERKLTSPLKRPTLPALPTPQDPNSSDWLYNDAEINKLQLFSFKSTIWGFGVLGFWGFGGCY